MINPPSVITQKKKPLKRSAFPDISPPLSYPSLSTDVIGVCKTVDELTRLTTKANREVSKRTVHLMDMSEKVVTVTLWGEEVSTWHGCRGEAFGTQVSVTNWDRFLIHLSNRLATTREPRLDFVLFSWSAATLTVCVFKWIRPFSCGVIPLLDCGGAAAMDRFSEKTLVFWSSSR